MNILDLVVVSTVTAVVVAAVVAALKVFVGTLPDRVWKWFLSRITLTVTIRDSDSEFAMLWQWLVNHPRAKKARSVQRGYSVEAKKSMFMPGVGSHWFWYNGPLLIKYTVSEPKDGEKKSYAVTMLAFRHEKMERFLSEIESYQIKDTSHLPIWNWTAGSWRQCDKKRKRPLSTVYLANGLLKQITKIIEDFLANEDWYLVRGIPYRLGIMLEGPPGTGKTSLASALAGHYNKHLFSMNLNEVGSDGGLSLAFWGARQDGVILIEDIDGFSSARDRGDIDVEESPKSAGSSNRASAYSFKLGPPSGEVVVVKKEKENKGITISGLLNAIDGVGAAERRILIFTTNDASKLDPALLRSGRMDHRFYLGNLEAEGVLAMFKNFYPDGAGYHDRILAYASTKSTTAAAWQKLFISYHDSADRLVEEGLK